MRREDILTGKAGLAGVQAILKGPTTRSLLRGIVTDLLSQGALTGPFQLTRAKYKPGRKISAFYTARYLLPGSNRVRTTPFAVTWEKPFETPSPVDEIEAMQEEVSVHNLLFPFRRLYAERPESGMRLKIWPLDLSFPQLPRVSDPVYMRAFFQGIPVTGSVDSGETFTVTPIRYRPGERHVLRYDLCPDGDPDPLAERLYIKLYKDGDDASRAFRVATRVVDWLDTGSQEVKGTRPVGASAEDAFIVYPHVPGVPLSRLLQHPSPQVSRYLQSIGKTLSFLHQGPETLVAELEENTFEQEGKAVLRACEHIRVLLPDAWNKVLRVTSSAQEIYAAMEQEKPTFTHSDFKADHLLADSGRLSLIDFDTCARADPAIDVGKFLADLEWWFALRKMPGIEQAQEEFLKGYGQGGNANRIIRARLFQLIIMIKIAARRAPLFSNDWPAVINRMVDRSEALLNALQRLTPHAAQ